MAHNSEHHIFITNLTEAVSFPWDRYPLCFIDLHCRKVYKTTLINHKKRTWKCNHHFFHECLELLCLYPTEQIETVCIDSNVKHVKDGICTDAVVITWHNVVYGAIDISLLLIFVARLYTTHKHRPVNEPHSLKDNYDSRLCLINRDLHNWDFEIIGLVTVAIQIQSVKQNNTRLIRTIHRRSCFKIVGNSNHTVEQCMHGASSLEHKHQLAMHTRLFVGVSLPSRCIPIT